MSDIEAKLGRVRDFMAGRGLEALALRRVSNFAWLTDGGASHIMIAHENGGATLVVTPDALHIVTNSIEAPRLEREEGLADLPLTWHVYPWYEPGRPLTALTQGRRLGADFPFLGATDIDADLRRVRAQLTPAESERMAEVGGRTGAALETAARRVRPGMSEFAIAGLITQAAFERSLTPVLALVAVDDRALAYRHPLPTARTLDRYAMLVICGRDRGLVASATRLVHIGPAPADLKARVEAVARVDTVFMQATRPGARLKEILQQAIAAYAQAGYPDEWQRHHQGGVAGYESREYLATPAAMETVVLGQAYAWNPSLVGTKSEDTLMVGEAGPRIVTATGDWPTVQGLPLPRPALLEL
ncbi:MAG: M24 family metallopeptidase [Anaerolineae bacterium]|nr:M24 family metallopeptidase [Anaerolineae bacterium]